MTIKRKGKKYVAYYSAGQGPTRYRKQRTFSDLQVAKKWEAKMALEHPHLKRLSDANIPFVEYYATYYKTQRTIAKGTQPRTLAGWHDTESALVSDPLGNKLVARIERQDVQSFLDRLGETHTRSTVKRRKMHIKSALEYAVDEGYIISNPAEHVKVNAVIPPKSDADKMFNMLELTQIRKYLESKDFTPDNVVYAAIYLLSQLGLRVGELLALEWSAIDWSLHEIHITKNWTEKEIDPKTGKLGKYVALKTAQSERTLPLTNAATKGLLKLLKAQSIFAKNNDVCTSGDMIFMTSRGGRLKVAVINKVMKRIQRELNFESTVRTSHAFRHTLASAMLAEGVPLLEIQHFLGHYEGSSVTSDVYIRHTVEMSNNNRIKVLKAIDPVATHMKVI